MLDYQNSLRVVLNSREFIEENKNNCKLFKAKEKMEQKQELFIKIIQLSKIYEIENNNEDEFQISMGLKDCEIC